MTTKMVEVNCTTNEVIEREMTKLELDAEKKLQKELSDKNAIAEQIELDKQLQRQTIAERLGLTADEAKLLLGGN
jgi:hypothetical protein